MKRRDRIIKWIAIVVFGIVLLGGPLVVKGEYARHILILILINAAFAEGLWIMLQAGESSFGQSAFAAVGGYCTAILSAQFNIDPWITFILGGIGAAIVAFLLGLIISHLEGLYFVICTFAFMELIRGLCINLESITGGASGIVGIRAPAGLLHFAGNRTLGFYYVALGVMILSVLVALAIKRSRLYLLFNAVEKNRVLSSSVGIYVRKYKLQAFIIGCFVTGLAGAVFASYLTQVAPANFGFLTSLDIVLFCYVGGIGSAIGPLVGAAVMTYTVNSLVAIGYYKMIVYGAILAFSILCLREGLISLPNMFLNCLERIRIRKGLKESDA